jgi:mannan endo-1,4-beta-mannosidase
LAWAVEPANRKSNPQVRAVLEYFCSLSGKTDNRVVSGQFTDCGNASNLKIMERIHESTGQWPALLGADYADFRRGSITTKVPNAAAIEYWRQGGLVSIMVHMYNPANPKGGGLRDKGVDIADVLKEGTDTHKRWMGAARPYRRWAAGTQGRWRGGVVATAPRDERRLVLVGIAKARVLYRCMAANV